MRIFYVWWAGVGRWQDEGGAASAENMPPFQDVRVAWACLRDLFWSCEHPAEQMRRAACRRLPDEAPVFRLCGLHKYTAALAMKGKVGEDGSLCFTLPRLPALGVTLVGASRGHHLGRQEMLEVSRTVCNCFYFLHSNCTKLVLVLSTTFPHLENEASQSICAISNTHHLRPDLDSWASARTSGTGRALPR